MARDYKNTWKKKSPARKAMPGWVWLTSGLAIGLFIAFLIWLDKRPVVSAGSAPQATDAPQATAKPAQTVQQGNKNAVKPAASTPPKPRFDFYTILPEMEVIVPAKEAQNRTPPNTPGAYFLQAGSFKNMTDADALKANLALLGIEAKIESVTVENDTWYRVRLGPYQDMEQLNKMLAQLRQNNINALPVKVKS